MPEIMRIENIGYAVNGAMMLNNITLGINAGEALFIAGKSGSGKSLLLEICAGLVRPQTGTVLWNGRNIASYTHDELFTERKSLGYLFQRYALIHNFTVYDNIALPLRYHTRLSEKEIRRAVIRCMELVELSGVHARFPNELSNGQIKKAALARALILQPQMLLADEITAGCDPDTLHSIVNVLQQIRKTTQTAVVMVCNDMYPIKLMQCPLKILNNGILIDSSELQSSSDNFFPSNLAAYQEPL